MTVAEQVTAESDDDLTGSLFALTALPVARLSLQDLLTRVATYAVRAIPGADGAGLTLIEHDRSDIVVTTDVFVQQIEDIQYGSINEGPCITAAATGETVRSGSLSADPRWPSFGPRVGRLVLHLARKRSRSILRIGAALVTASSHFRRLARVSPTNHPYRCYRE